MVEDSTRCADEAAKPSGDSSGITFPVVGIGASAGGLEALEEFVRAIPRRFGLAVVVVQHLAPTHESMLAPLLQRHTALPVLQIKDKTVLQADHIYIIPPNASLSLDGATLRVKTPREPRGRRLPIDVFLTSLAESLAERAACIILSGTGSDGSQGLIEIKEHGGLTMAQAGATARYDSMPRNAEATGLVDHVLPVSDMPARLVAYFRHLEVVDGNKGIEGLRAEAESELQRICRLLHKRTGHDFSQYKPSTLTRRVQRRMHILGLDEVSAYLAHLERDPEEPELLFRDLLISVTQFFRDPEVFEIVDQEIIEKLVASKRPDEPIRIWVPGCATGQEAYSLAMLLAERAQTSERAVRIQVFGTDIDDRALEVARAGLYSLSVLDEVEPERAKRWFVRDGETVRVTSALREMCVFSTHNLIKDPPFSRLDLVSCRNLLIYMTSDLQEKVLSLFHYALNPGGWLLLGPSETATVAGRLFKGSGRSRGIFRRRDEVQRAGAPFPTSTLLYQPPAGIPTRAREQSSLARRVEQSIVEEFSPPHVVVNANFQVLFFSGQTASVLSTPRGAPSSNLLEMAKLGLRMHLRAAVFDAIRTGELVYREAISFEDGADRQTLDLHVRPLPRRDSDDRVYLIIFDDAPYRRRSSDVSRPSAGESVQSINVLQLENELRLVRENLRTTVEELETSNEELKSANEELLSMNEELQSANEELETSKEELQSGNEELETVNAELRSKVEDLSRANSDLKNFLESTRIATIFINRELRIQLFTPMAREIFRLRESDIGRPLTDIASRLSQTELEQDARHVLSSLAPRERQIEGDNDTVFIMRMMPYRTVDDVIDGLVMTFVEITGLKRAEQKLNALARTHQQQLTELKTLYDTAPVGLGLVDRDLRYLRLNDALAEINGKPVEAHIGRTVREVLPELADTIVPIHLRVLETGEMERDIEVRGRTPAHPDEERVWLADYYPLLEGDEVRAIGVFVREITRLKQHEQEVLESSERLRLTLERAPVTLYTVDRNLRYTWEAGAIGQGPFEAVVGRTDHDLLPAEQAAHLMALKREALDNEKAVRGEVTLCRPDGAAQTWEFAIEPARDADGEVTGLLMAGLEITERKRAEQHRLFLIAELNHRVKNTLAAVRSMIVRSLSAANDIAQLEQMLVGRIDALARTHQLLSSTDWSGVSLKQMVESEFEPYRKVRADSTHVEGPNLILASSAASMLAMTLHELTINAAKHGALSAPEGRVRLYWELELAPDAEDGRVLHIVWEESGGPPVVEPQRSGFGRQLIERGISYELGARVETAFAEEGYRWQAWLPAGRSLAGMG